MSEKKERMEQIVGTLWVALGKAKAELEEKVGELDQDRVSPALFTAFATATDGLLTLTEKEGETLWYSFVEVADQLLKAGKVTREQCAAMSAVMDETSELITQACERKLVEKEQMDPIAAILEGTAKSLGVEYDPVKETVGPWIANYISGANRLTKEE